MPRGKMQTIDPAMMCLHSMRNLLPEKICCPAAALRVSVCLLAYYGSYDIARTVVVTEFAEADSLPRPEIKPSVGYGNGQR